MKISNSAYNYNGKTDSISKGFRLVPILIILNALNDYNTVAYHIQLFMGLMM